MRLKIDNLTVTYDEPVVENLNLIVEDGEFCTLVGHSGTGKSTILKSIAGLIDIKVNDILLNNDWTINKIWGKSFWKILIRLFGIRP